MTLDHTTAKSLLEKHGQSHVLAFWDKLDKNQRTALLAQVATLDFDAIAYMQSMLAKASEQSIHTDIQPAKVFQLKPAERANAVKAGETAIRAGEVGVILVAGGQGSRLGFEGPKGCYEIGPVTSQPLFRIHARKVLALERKYAAHVPFYIMTSDVNDRPTRDFFRHNKFFGLDKSRVKFFTQGMWPALTADRRIVLDQPDHIFMSPDGHGGTLSALKANGMLEDMKKRGIKTLFYFQVDNPLVEVADPAFIGLHCLEKSGISIKVCAKRDAEEGLGVVVERQGRNAITEYTELTKEQKHALLPDGNLKFRFGSVAIHVFSYDFLVQEASARLPLHIAHKKVPYCDSTGSLVKPDKPNAYKFEKFIFDVIPDAEKSINLEFAREDEFSPVKNATGADSPEMTRRDMILKFARWFDSCGIAVPRGADGLPTVKIEIDPCYALSAEDLKAKLPKGFKITGDVLLNADC